MDYGICENWTWLSGTQNSRLLSFGEEPEEEEEEDWYVDPGKLLYIKFSKFLKF